MKKKIQNNLKFYSTYRWPFLTLHLSNPKQSQFVSQMVKDALSHFEQDVEQQEVSVSVY